VVCGRPGNDDSGMYVMYPNASSASTISESLREFHNRDMHRAGDQLSRRFQPTDITAHCAMAPRGMIGGRPSAGWSNHTLLQCVHSKGTSKQQEESSNHRHDGMQLLQLRCSVTQCSSGRHTGQTLSYDTLHKAYHTVSGLTQTQPWQGGTALQRST